MQSAEMEKQRTTFLNSKPCIEVNQPFHFGDDIVKISTLDENQLLTICDQLNIRNIPLSYLKTADIFCNVSRNSLYFPLVDVNNTTVGFKKLSFENGKYLESTMPLTKSFGAVVHASKGALKQKSAIVVLNVLDWLALVGENIHSEFYNYFVALI